MRQEFSKRKLAAILVTVAASGFVALNWQSLLFASAVVVSDKRPILLRDAQWNKPPTALAFQQRFGRGSSEVRLIQWLKANHFDIDQRGRRASLKVRGVPRAEDAAVTWTAINGNINASEAVVSEAGCL